MDRLTFGPRACTALAEAASHEWLVVDGLGGYAMGTVSGLRTRRQHGLLAVPAPDTAGPAAAPGWRLALAALDPVLVLGDVRVRLGTHEWASGAVDPAGHELLVSFALDGGVPRWRWSVDGIVVEREIAMLPGRAATGVVVRLVAAPRPVRLELEALATWRAVGATRTAGGAPEVVHDAHGFVFDGAYRVHGPAWRPGGAWWLGARHRADVDLADPADASGGAAADGSEAGGAHDDLWCAGAFVVDLEPGARCGVLAWAGDLDDVPPPAPDVVAAARARHARLTASVGSDTTAARLAVATDRHVVHAADGPAVVAAYPAAGTRWRAAVLGYEGLFLDTDRADLGRDLLRAAAGGLGDGLLRDPATPGDVPRATADTALWFVHALDRHVVRTGDLDLAAELLVDAEAVVAALVAGTAHGIAVDPVDGLLAQGAPGMALTWMDARIDGVPVTPRAGKAVELSALWVHALEALAVLQRQLGRDDGRTRALAERARASFLARFVRGGRILDTANDAATRPNALLAIALPFGPLRGAAVARGAVDLARAELLTPLGLRTLAPSEPGYRGRERGGPSDRAAARHQGSAWPALLGWYVDAALATASGDAEAVLDGLEAHLAEWGLGGVSERADGDAPHLAHGAPFHAWATAELLRARRRLGDAGAAAGAPLGAAAGAPAAASGPSAPPPAGAAPPEPSPAPPARPRVRLLRAATAAVGIAAGAAAASTGLVRPLVRPLVAVATGAPRAAASFVSASLWRLTHRG